MLDTSWKTPRIGRNITINVKYASIVLQFKFVKRIENSENKPTLKIMRFNTW